MAQCRPVKPSEQLAPSSRYELVLRLAAGGMGSVFLGFDRDEPTTLRAIKRAHAHLMRDASFRKMFVREARLASRFDTPNAVGVLDVDDSDGELFMVMRYVEGPSLAGLLEATVHDPVELRRWALLRVIIDAARGLEAAHCLRDEGGKPLGIVHRDVSPHNILVSVSGVASIVDFGIAKAMSEIEVTNTATNVVKGKFAFMAPEYLRNRIVGPRSDLFSLGVVAWESLASTRLFRRDNDADTAANLLSADEAQPLDEVAVGFAPAVAQVIARALKKKPEERFATAGDFADALEAAAKRASSLAEQSELSAMVQRVFGSELESRRSMVAAALRAREEAKAAEAMVPAQSVLRMSSQRPPAAGADLEAQLDMPLSHAKTTVRLSAPLVELAGQRASVASAPSEDEDETLDAPATLQHPPEPTRVAPAPRPAPRRLVTIGVAIGVASALTLGFFALRRTGEDVASASTNEPAKVDADAPAVAESAAPAVESAAPAVESAAPAVESAAPAVESAAPAVESAAPAVASAAVSASAARAPAARPPPPRRPKGPVKYNPQGI